jgi:hypothetical protein
MLGWMPALQAEQLLLPAQARTLTVIWEGVCTLPTGMPDTAGRVVDSATQLPPRKQYCIW